MATIRRARLLVVGIYPLLVIYALIRNGEFKLFVAGLIAATPRSYCAKLNRLELRPAIARTLWAVKTSDESASSTAPSDPEILLVAQDEPDQEQLKLEKVTNQKRKLISLLQQQKSTVPFNSFTPSSAARDALALSSTTETRSLPGTVLMSNGQQDPVLADPITKQPLIIRCITPPILGGGVVRRTFSMVNRPVVQYELRSDTNFYTGSSDRFMNLLEPVTIQPASLQSTSSSSWTTSTTLNKDHDSNSSLVSNLFRTVQPLIPPPIRSVLATAGLPMGTNYVPMRDLFTSPAVSFAYERGWRDGFVTAGFPGADQEAIMAMEYFAPAIALNQYKNNVTSDSVLVDMSCASGLFTRRFAASGRYGRVLGCDYSASMLSEAAVRIQSDRKLLNQIRQSKTQLDLIRCDVGSIPMQDESVDALHAGAAMHCWPNLPAAVSEIYRVLKPSGRYFATTFLSSWFGNLQAAEGGTTGPSRQAFQYFESIDQLRRLLVNDGGFDPGKVFIEVLGRACVVIRCEK